MRCTMSWTDTVKAAALAVQAERTATAAATALDTRPTWNAQEVWLSHVRHSRDVAIQRSMTDATTQPRRGTAHRD